MILLIFYDQVYLRELTLAFILGQIGTLILRFNQRVFLVLNLLIFVLNRIDRVTVAYLAIGSRVDYMQIPIASLTQHANIPLSLQIALQLCQIIQSRNKLL